MRVVIDDSGDFNKTEVSFGESSDLSCHWICCPDIGSPPFITVYRKRFQLAKDAVIRAHVSADERYTLFLDGERIGRGSERGDANNWFYETYDMPLTKGEHVIVARVWSLGEKAPLAQISVAPGFFFCPEEKYIDILGTGISDWQVKKLAGFSFTNLYFAFGIGHKESIDANKYEYDYRMGDGDGWCSAIRSPNGTDSSDSNDSVSSRKMRPATLPPMMEKNLRIGKVRYVGDVAAPDIQRLPINKKDTIAEEMEQWNIIKNGSSVTMTPNSSRRIVIDLEDYYCAYMELVTSGGKGASIRVNWAESLYLDSEEDYENVHFRYPKGNRNEIEGKYFKLAIGSTLIPDGGDNCRFDPLWWYSGRYIEIYIQVAQEPLTIKSFDLYETRYPLEMESSFVSNDSRLSDITPIALRTLQMCAHETYMDCPYYEQLMYVGDTRLEALTTFVLTRDDGLARKAIKMFSASRLPNGLTQACYPYRDIHVIPPFSLWWIAMVHDYACWRNAPKFVGDMIKCARHIIDYFISRKNGNGLISPSNKQQWGHFNFMDWVPEWGDMGVPPGHDQINSVFNWQLVLVLKQYAELEEAFGDKKRVRDARQEATLLADRIMENFWDESRGVFADDMEMMHYSEHTQCLAILSGEVENTKYRKISETLFNDRNLVHTSIYFTHYLFEVCRKLERMDILFDRLSLWFTLKKEGFRTTYENAPPVRSDCHAWASHPLYHFFATILGIRPGSFGFDTVHIMPQLGPLTEAKGTMIHPKGTIIVDFHSDGDRIKGSINLPDGLGGTFSHKGRVQALYGGIQEVE